MIRSTLQNRREQRHKLIFELLKGEIELIHAISLHLYTQNEYNLKNK
ncbi:MAG: BolA/IbaG family iron-sulfur metabolism protein [Wolbachia endosymbiont of Halictus tumulorum]|nr:BolA/IbaG family iron-sulfur metabolism protein [Wolbachia endosymbiont of Halictus tumulorum]